MSDSYEVDVVLRLEVSADSPAEAAQRARELLAGFTVEDLTVSIPGLDDGSVLYEDGHETPPGVS